MSINLAIFVRENPNMEENALGTRPLFPYCGSQSQGIALAEARFGMIH